MPWLPTAPEKVEFFEEIGLDRRLLRGHVMAILLPIWTEKRETARCGRVVDYLTFIQYSVSI